MTVAYRVDGTSGTLLRRPLADGIPYYGVTSNFDALARFMHGVERIWQKWLSRRSQKAFLNWDAMKWLLKRYPLPPPRIVHRYGT